MTKKRQTSQGYIIRILQHFATKLWNITNSVMLFQAVMKFCLDQNLVYNANAIHESEAPRPNDVIIERVYYSGSIQSVS